MKRTISKIMIENSGVRKIGRDEEEDHE